MKALVIAPQPFFSPRGTPFSVYYRTLLLAEHGVKVDLLTYGEGQDVEIPGVHIIRIPRFSFLGPVEVGPSWLKLFLDCFLFLWSAGLMARNRYDFVHAHEESVFFCRWLKPIFRFKLVYDMHSSLPQQLRNFEFTSSRVLIRLFEKLENASLRSADAVITICPELASYALPRLRLPQRHFLIENSIFDEVQVRSRVASGNGESPLLVLPEGRRLVAYAGTFEPYQGVDLLVRSFSRVLERVPDAFLLLIGGTQEQVSHLRALVSRSGLESHVLLTGRLDFRATRSLLARAAVLTSPRTQGTNTPLKIYEQLASGIPLVATRVRSHTQVLDDEVCFLVEPNPEAIGEGIIAALTDGARRSQVIESALALYANRYSRPVYKAAIKRLLEALGGCAVS